MSKAGEELIPVPDSPVSPSIYALMEEIKRGAD